MPTLLMAASLAASALSVAWAGEPAAAQDAEARYQKERAACLSGQSPQSRDACLREAGAARDEARRQKLAVSGADFEKNALARCQPLPEPERGDCQARARGQGKQSGSVASGGIYRETVTRTVGEPTTPAAPDEQPRDGDTPGKP